MRYQINGMHGAQENMVLILSAVEACVFLLYLLTNMFWPTPGRSDKTGMFSCSNVALGPIPDTMSNCGERNWHYQSSVSRDFIPRLNLPLLRK